MLPLARHSKYSLKIISLFFWIISVAGCQNKPAHEEAAEPKQTERVKAKVAQVMAVHDKAMPLITDIYQLKKKLKGKILENPERDNELKPLIAHLDSADHRMRVWMHEWSDVKTTGLPDQEILATLQIEQDKITKISDEMFESVANARDVK